MVLLIENQWQFESEFWPTMIVTTAPTLYHFLSFILFYYMEINHKRLFVVLLVRFNDRFKFRKTQKLCFFFIIRDIQSLEQLILW
jgi:hypothetical protein